MVCCNWSVLFQDIVEVGTGNLRAYEALIRVPDMAVEDFIKVMEDQKRTHEITAFVFKKTIEMTKEREIPIIVGINISAQEVERCGYSEWLIEMARKNNFDLRQLVLEITETNELKKDKIVYENIWKLKEAGVRFAIDDFGIAYSNLDRILNFPFDIVKLDRIFLSQIEASHRMEVLLRDMVEILKRYDVKLVLEGIEEKEHQDMAQRMGIDFMQGYYIGRPRGIKYEENIK